MKKRAAMRQAKLVLEDGSEYAGWSFGKARSQAGEVVFTTDMGGYVQYLTDPNYRGQIVVSAYPMVGNCGVPVQPKTGEPSFDERGLPRYFESSEVQVSAFVTAEVCEEPSHYSSGATLSEWLEKNSIPGIAGVDTRALTARIRERGTMMGKILVEGSRDVTLDSGHILHPVEEVSPKEMGILKPYDRETSEGEPLKILLTDCGAKAGILRYFLARNVEIIRLPWDYDPNGIAYDGILLSNGPGDPKNCGKTIAMVRRAFQKDKPIFGIGLGNLIMALAAGADTYKLPYGHRGQNQPCLEAGTRHCFITSQNHGYAVRRETLPKDWEPWFVNANDGSIEGIRSLERPFSATQFHPEGCPGPRDTEFLLENFIDNVRDYKRRSLNYPIQA